ncbi:MAG: tRNA (guanosine(46)-N7)-methyltransferase TrmB [Oscillospiraceae bacterium]|nr:tRNA (guanosine(46)-N7)-methyltransferase TrmB [Oscillospiraceae bacterium]
MRIRKKTNLGPRMEKCAAVLIEKPEDLSGQWRAAFPGYDRLWLELGCGKGAFTVETAAQNPTALYLALEKVPDAMVMAMERVCGRGLENVRFFDRDALLLPYIFAPGEVDRIYINFCDPWPRSHDAKHRLSAPGFLRKYADTLPIGGEIHFKTDNDPLFAWSLEQFKSEGWILSEVTSDLHAGGPCGVMTDYEARFYAEGVTINRLVAARAAATRTTADGEPPRMYNAGIERPYRTRDLFGKETES